MLRDGRHDDLDRDIGIHNLDCSTRQIAYRVIKLILVINEKDAADRQRTAKVGARPDAGGVHGGTASSWGGAYVMLRPDPRCTPGPGE